MLVSECYSKLPRRAGRMSMDDYIDALNFVVFPDIAGLVQNKWGDVYIGATQISVDINEFSITSIETDALGSKIIAPGVQASVGDIVLIEGTENYNNRNYVLGLDTDAVIVSTPFSVTEAGTIKTPSLYLLPSRFVYMRNVVDSKYGELYNSEFHVSDQACTKYNIKGDKIIFPISTVATDVSLYYTAEIPLITAETDPLPFEEHVHEKITPILNYGAALQHFRDRRKVDDIKVYYDLYMQAKQNEAVLKNKSL